MRSEHLGAAMRHINQLFGEGTLAGLPDAQLLQRYIAHRDEIAFKALVQRHGPMVVAVCRGVLNDPNDADDAFQAVFLLLARKAGSLWVNDSLGGWLHRVAWRIALQMRTDTARRRDQEIRAGELANARTSSNSPWDDAHLALHQEIDRLPERYRKPIVLCYLEDMTYQQAANHLCWSEATTQGRLARGRKLLRRRLTRRGVTLAGAILVAVARPKTASAVSAAMIRATVRSAHHFSLGKSVMAETTSASVDALLKQALRTMMIAKLKMVAAPVLIVGALSCVATGLAAPRTFVADQPVADSSQLVEDRPEPSSTDRSGRARRPARTAGNGIMQPFGQVRTSDRRRGRPATPRGVVRAWGEAVNLFKDLGPRARLNRGDSLFSSLGGFRLHMQDDGNLVLYVIDDTQIPPGPPATRNGPPGAAIVDLWAKGNHAQEVWSTGTHLPGDGVGTGAYCVMEPDGDFVVYDQSGHPCFSTGTKGSPGAFLRCQNDGNLVIYGYIPEFAPIWRSKTHAGLNGRDELPDLLVEPSGAVVR